MDPITLTPGADGVWTFKFPTAEAPKTDAPKDKAELEAPAQFVRDINRFEVAGIPVGGPFLGGLGAVALVELIDGFVRPTTPNAAIFAKLVAAAAAATPMARDFLGEAANWAAGFMLFSAAQQALPLEAQIRRAIQGITQATRGAVNGSTTMVNGANLAAAHNGVDITAGRARLVGL